MRNALVLLIMGGLLNGCIIQAMWYDNKAETDRKTTGTEAPVEPTEPRPDESVGRRVDPLFSPDPTTLKGRLNTNEDDKTSTEEQLALDRGNDAFNLAGKRFNDGDYAEARRLYAEAISYHESFAPKSREPLRLIEEKLGPVDPMAGLTKAQQLEVIKARRDALELSRSGAELIRSGEFDGAVEAYELALHATERMPAGLHRRNWRYRITTMIRYGKALRTKHGEREVISSD